MYSIRFHYNRGCILYYYVLVYHRQSNGYIWVSTGEFSHEIDEIKYNDNSRDIDKMYNIKATNFLQSLKTRYRYDISISGANIDDLISIK